jgi:hypothetical protein
MEHGAMHGRRVSHPEHCDRQIVRQPEMSHDTTEKLGLERLSRLALEAAARDAGFRILLKAALTALKCPEAVAAIVDRRLGALATARRFIDWRIQRTRATASRLSPHSRCSPT